MNNRLKFPVTVLTKGIAGLALVTAACAVYKVINNRNRSEDDSEKGIHVRHLRNKMDKYTYEKRILCYHHGLPVWLVKCDMKKANGEADFWKEKKFVSPCIVYREDNFFGMTEEFCIFVHEDENYKKISDRAKKVAVDHELGHIFMAKDPCLEFSSEDDADKYAVEKNGKISRQEARQISAWVSGFQEKPDCMESEFMSRFG